ncbi:SusC/RagA family TonB-linked outer membrane protein [Siphonobacter aquaeclarae]|uniref:TonB-linked outer membrane protein, SusC/RagA family n=1 Tax=Siphonobacter aquaeclarae TaxID=563176 RepID=A0A1G9HMU7_9BACT|nr:TonB-dependent receptor [Siphonobacter aquaeclarae]SDL14116.1 TonB-linked outer membrane protein, SusC/RagA family [Siphonobacter aquaeclarae]
MNRILPLLFLWLLAAPLWAQQFALRGKVTTRENEPLVGATVRVKGTQTAALTDGYGGFRLQLPGPGSVLQVSYVGFSTVEVEVGGRTSLTIVLETDSKVLNDVVITGYSVQNRKDIVGSVTRISGEDLKGTPAASFNQLLQGKATGVQVTSNSGVPGGGITFRVRGNNSINASVDPLYVIDGVFVSNTEPIRTSIGNQQQSNPLADINPADIESIQILKDANATAIYGSLGANGVVIVTTKRGSLNTKARITANISHGWSDAVKKFRATTGPETGTLVNEAAVNTAIDRGVDPSTITLPFADPSKLPTYDRISDLFRVAGTSSYDLSAQGGTARSTYFAGFSYLKQESIVKPSDFERYTVRFNYDNHLSDKVKLGNSLNITRTYRNVSSNDNNPTGVINSAIFPRSYLPVFNDDGTYARSGSFDNHLALIRNLNNNAVGWRTIANLYAEWAILPELTLKSSWSLDNSDMYENNYSNTLISAGIATKGSAASYETKNLILTNEQILTWRKSFGEKHRLHALVGNTVNSVIQESTTATGQGFATNNLTSISVAATTLGSSSRAVARLVSFFGKAGYTFDNRFTLDVSLRADASSKFGADRRWGYFPSAGVAWNASNESFVKDLGVFNELKFRASIGLSGNQNGIGSYAAQGLWSSGSNYLETAGTSPSQLENRLLTWETTRQVDIGTEFSILNNRLGVTVDYYNKYTYDLLLNVPVPSRSGFTTYLQNFGAVRNKGVEIALHSRNIEGRNFRWSTDFNISFNRNKIEKLASDIALGASGRNISILRQGYAVNSFQLYKQLYVDPQTGNAVYEDVNKDGILTSADRQIVGNALPRFTGGLTNTLSYKQFDLNFLFYFQEGNKIMSMHDFFLVHGGTQNFIGFIPRQLERWQKPGDVTDIPRLTTYSGAPTVNGGPSNNYGGNVANQSSRYLLDGSFIRLRNVSLGYTVPQSIVKRAGLTNVRAYVQAANLLTFTRFTGLDPEVSSQSNSQNTAGYDWATVPQPRTVQVGVSVTL